MQQLWKQDSTTCCRMFWFLLLSPWLTHEKVLSQILLDKIIEPGSSRTQLKRNPKNLSQTDTCCRLSLYLTPTLVVCFNLTNLCMVWKLCQVALQFFLLGWEWGFPDRPRPPVLQSYPQLPAPWQGLFIALLYSRKEFHFIIWTFPYLSMLWPEKWHWFVWSQVHLDRNVMEEAVLEEAEFYNVAGGFPRVRFTNLLLLSGEPD